jgi:beta-glucanase (GH16 family)
VATDNVQTPNTTVLSVSGAGLGWQLVQRANSQLGTAEIWRAFSGQILNRVTVTANLSQSVAASITVMTFAGADTSGTNGSGAIGGTSATGAPSGAPTLSLKTSRNGSLVLGVGNDWDHAVNRVVGSSQLLVHQFEPTAGDTYWVQRQNAPTPLSGTQVTINDNSPTGDRYNLAIVEVLPAPAGQPAPAPSPTPTPAPTPSPSPTPTPSPTPGLVFDEEFGGNSLDLTQWTPMNRCGDISHQAELERYTPAQCTVTNGALNLTAVPNGGVQCNDFNLDGSIRSTHQTSYDSCMVQTSAFNFQFGTLEFRVLSTNPGLGTWPGSLWLEGANCQSSNVDTADVNGSGLGTCNWPNVGSEEIDPCEIKSSDAQPNTQVWQNTFSSTGVSSPEFSSQTPWSDPTVNWHVCKIIWNTDSVTWFVDGVQTRQILKANGDPVPQGPLFILINVAIGGAGSSTPDPANFPQTMQIDYVRVSK